MYTPLPPPYILEIMGRKFKEIVEEKYDFSVPKKKMVVMFRSFPGQTIWDIKQSIMGAFQWGVSDGIHHIRDTGYDTYLEIFELPEGLEKNFRLIRYRLFHHPDDEDDSILHTLTLSISNQSNSFNSRWDHVIDIPLQSHAD